MNGLPQRRINRLSGFMYGGGNTYFLTICTPNRQHLLGEVVGGGVLDAPHVQLSGYGQIVEQMIHSIEMTYCSVHVDSFVIMPDHLHLLVTIQDDGGTSRTPSPTNRRIPALISTLKRLTNRRIGRPIWQRSYYDHVVRNQADFDEILRYIQNNPAAWAENR